VYRALHYAQRSASAHNTLGTILDALGRVDGAREAYRRAFILDPGAGWALSNLCYLEFRQGQFAEARRHCEAALRAMPALAEAHNNLGLAHAASGDLAAAKSAFLGTGDSAAAHYNLGIVHLAADHYVEAARAFEAALEARPDFTAAKSRAHEARMRLLTAGNRKKPS
jgi:Flp pilus assembly protein TadD